MEVLLNGYTIFFEPTPTDYALLGLIEAAIQRQVIFKMDGELFQVPPPQSFDIPFRLGYRNREGFLGDSAGNTGVYTGWVVAISPGVVYYLPSESAVNNFLRGYSLLSERKLEVQLIEPIKSAIPSRVDSYGSIYREDEVIFIQPLKYLVRS